MHVLVTDETNREPSKEAKFFIYGGILVDMAQIPEIHDEIEGLRLKSNYPANAELKFSPNSRPADFDKEVFNGLKGKILDLAIKKKVRFIANLVPHPVAENQGVKKTIEFGLNTVLTKFDQFLRETNARGLAFIDNPNIEHPFQYASDAFLIGLEFPFGDRKRLSRVCGLSMIGAGTSHLSSIMDIVLGTFRYCVNASKDTELVRRFLPIVVRMMWGQVHNKKKDIMERGLIVRPKKMIPAYQTQTNALVTRLIRIANEGFAAGA